MKDNKDLGKLFKERLEHAEAAPSDGLWSQIENTLDKSQRRRGFMRLWLLGIGVLLLLSTAYYGISRRNDTERAKPELTTKVPNSNQNILQKKEVVNHQIERSVGKNEENQVKETNTMVDSAIPLGYAKQKAATPQHIIAKKKLSPSVAASNTNGNTHQPAEKTKTTTTVALNKEQRDKLPKNKAKTNTNTTYQTTSQINEPSVIAEPTSAAKPNSDRMTSVAAPDEKRLSDASNHGVAKREPRAQSTVALKTVSTGIPLEKQSAQKAIKASPKEKGAPQTAIDSTMTAEQLGTNKTVVEKDTGKKSLDEMLVAKKIVKEEKSALDTQEIEKEKPKNKNWWLSFQASPNLYGYFKESSPFDSAVDSSQQKAGISFSYGALVNIPLNEKFTFRFGYRNVKLKSNTVNATSGVEPFNPPILVTRAINHNQNLLSDGFVTSITSGQPFRIEQEISYYDFPFQFLYQLNTKKLRIDAIAGVSLMATNKTKVFIKNDIARIERGTATYLRAYTIAPTLGVGFHYPINETITLDLEPVFQYHINAFETEYKNPHPFIMNLNIGVSLKF